MFYSDHNANDMSAYISFAASALCCALVVLVEGIQALAYGAAICATATSIGNWAWNMTRAIRFARFLIKSVGKTGARLLYILVGVVALALIFALFAVFALFFSLFNQAAQQSTTPANVTNGTLYNVTTVCQCPAPTPYSILTPLTCDGRVSHAALSTVHDLNAIDQVDEDVSFIARGRLADLNKAWVRQIKAFVSSYDSVRNQYTRLQSKSIPRYIEAERQRLSGGGSDCVDVEWAAVQAEFQALERAGLSCESLWNVVYAQPGLADQFASRIAVSKETLEEQPVGYLADLIPGMSPNDRRHSHTLLSGALQLMTSLQDAHGLAGAQRCKLHERRVMEASWKQVTEQHIAGVAVRKDVSVAELDGLVEKRLDWAMLYTSPDWMDLS